MIPLLLGMGPLLVTPGIQVVTAPLLLKTGSLTLAESVTVAPGRVEATTVVTGDLVMVTPCEELVGTATPEDKLYEIVAGTVVLSGGAGTVTVMQTGALVPDTVTGPFESTVVVPPPGFTVRVLAPPRLLLNRRPSESIFKGGMRNARNKSRLGRGNRCQGELRTERSAVGSEDQHQQGGSRERCESFHFRNKETEYPVI
ncbi:hypothetical protein FPV67DRAFT_508893 [Lyophyllum atratum]|nr:hypothetical protein FPV67DRAFT_508893 [Lyophyllum atratum]